MDYSGYGGDCEKALIYQSENFQSESKCMEIIRQKVFCQLKLRGKTYLLEVQLSNRKKRNLKMRFSHGLGGEKDKKVETKRPCSSCNKQREHGPFRLFISHRQNAVQSSRQKCRALLAHDNLLHQRAAVGGLHSHDIQTCGNGREANLNVGGTVAFAIHHCLSANAGERP